MKSEVKKWYFGKLCKKEVKEEFIKKVAANVQNTQLEEVEDINEIRNTTKKGINEADEKIMGREKKP